MNAPEKRSWTERTGNHGRAVEERLITLQDSHRLGIHMIEAYTEDRNTAFQVPEITIEKLGTLGPESIDQELQHGSPQLFSLSLIPSNQSSISMRPFEVRAGGINNYGYLFDLSQTNEHPARVVRVSPSNLGSGELHSEKNFTLKEYDHGNEEPITDTQLHKTLHDFYRTIANFFEPIIFEDRNKEAYFNQMSRWQQAIIKAVATNPSALSEHQLDMLGKAYEDRPESYVKHLGGWDDGIAEHNEILVSCHRNHIAAIVVPAHLGNSTLAPNLYQAQIRLQAALVGLDHLNKNIHLPVVIYDVDHPESKQKIHFVGQTREELTRIGLEALSTLNEESIAHMERQNDTSMYYNLVNAVEKYFNIDITRTDWHERAQDAADLMKATPAPSSQSHQTSPASGGR